MSVVLLERNGIRDLTRHSPYPDIYAQLGERRHKFLVKVGYALRSHGHRDDASLTGLDEDPVFDEIKLYLDIALLVGHRRSGHAAGSNVEGHIPPVIHQRAQL